jgi:drug/metabolite transporter (DMT)-like permease
VFLPISLPQWPATAPSTDALISVVALAVVCTAAAFILFGALIEAIGPVRATVITYINPAVAAVLGVVVLNEIIAPSMIVGFVLVIIGSVLATRPARATAQVDPTETPIAADSPADLRGVGDRAGA